MMAMEKKSKLNAALDAIDDHFQKTHGENIPAAGHITFGDPWRLKVEKSLRNIEQMIRDIKWQIENLK